MINVCYHQLTATTEFVWWTTKKIHIANVYLLKSKNIRTIHCRHVYTTNEVGTHNCGNGDCEDTERSYKCHCHPGYRNKNGDISKTCVNFNECENVDQYCQNGKCGDGEGDYICNCFEGFTNEGGGTREDNLDSTCVPSKYNNT